MEVSVHLDSDYNYQNYDLILKTLLFFWSVLEYFKNESLINNNITTLNWPDAWESELLLLAFLSLAVFDRERDLEADDLRFVSLVLLPLSGDESELSEEDLLFSLLAPFLFGDLEISNQINKSQQKKM